MQSFRSFLPSLLMYLGVGTGVLALVFALLSLHNPLMMALLLILGPGFGGMLWGVGILVENSETAARNSTQVAADTRAATKATLAMVQEMRTLTSRMFEER